MVAVVALVVDEDEDGDDKPAEELAVNMEDIIWAGKPEAAVPAEGKGAAAAVVGKVEGVAAEALASEAEGVLADIEAAWLLLLDVSLCCCC